MLMPGSPLAITEEPAVPSTIPVISVHDLTTDYRKQLALRGINLAVEPGAGRGHRAEGQRQIHALQDDPRFT
jgi:hypothetical protein